MIELEFLPEAPVEHEINRKFIREYQTVCGSDNKIDENLSIAFYCQTLSLP